VVSGRPRLLTLSGSSPAALDAITEKVAGQLEGRAGLAGLAAGLQAEPAAGPFRRVVVAADPAQAARYLRKGDRRRVFSGQAEPGRPMVFMFSGVGDQYPGLAAGVYQGLPAFREEMDQCFGILRPELGMDLRAILYPRGAEADRPAVDSETADKAAMFDQRRAAGEIHRTVVAQPLVFAVQYALARALRSLGAEPSALLGYSIGEYVAACLAGVLPLEPMLRVIALRARLVADLPEGAMLAVMSGEQAVQPYLDARLSIAALDGPQLTVLAGPADAIGQAGQRLTAGGIACRELPTSHAFHSAMMEPVVQPLRELLCSFPLRPPAIPVLSNCTGTWLSAGEAISPGYWARHLRQTVRFADELAEVWQLGRPILIELGPGRALGQLARQSQLLHGQLAGAGQAGPGGETGLILHTLPGPFEGRLEAEVLLDAVGRLWATGTEINFSELQEIG
jgi:acyl transferase domain-containing protein